MKPTTEFPCSRCSKPVLCWPYRAATATCPDCLRAVRVANGKRRTAGQTPSIGATQERRFRDGQTYRQVYRPDHPNAPKRGWMMEHRLIMEAVLGRLLTCDEVVHHDDRNGLNNDPANLVLEVDKGTHLGGEHASEGGRASVASRPVCACGARAAHGEAVCWKCWSRSQHCPVCDRPGRKMARRDICHGCYKGLRRREGRLHAAPKENIAV